jgi:hypothetical protein
VHLNTRAIELVFERRLTERGERLVDARCGFGEHRLNRLERAQQKLRQLGVAIDDGGVRDGREIARQHAGAPNPRGRNARRARDGLDQHPLERALSELAEQQAHEEVLLVGRRPAEQPTQDLGAGTRGSGASRSRQTIECAIDVRDLEVGRSRGRQVAHGRQLGAADADPALTHAAAQKRDDDDQFVGRHSPEQVGKPADLVETPGRRANLAGNGHDFRQAHPNSVLKSAIRPAAEAVNSGRRVNHG